MLSLKINTHYIEYKLTVIAQFESEARDDLFRPSNHRHSIVDYPYRKH